jgi:hypothetical protein
MLLDPLEPAVRGMSLCLIFVQSRAHLTSQLAALLAQTSIPADARLAERQNPGRPEAGRPCTIRRLFDAWH